MDVVNLRDYEHLSPFEIKDELIRLARTSGQASAHMFLNAVCAIARDYMQACRSAQRASGAPPMPDDFWPKEPIK